MASVDSNRLALDVAFDKGVDGGPFAMLRSMYVTEFNNDMARIAVREKGAKSWREDNIMKFDKAQRHRHLDGTLVAVAAQHVGARCGVQQLLGWPLSEAPEERTAAGD